MRRLAIADIHGCAAKLLQVLQKSKYDPRSDRLFLLGDYVDRGLEPARTVEIVRRLQADGAIVLRGNHDHGCVRAHRDASWMPIWTLPQNGGAVTLADYGGRAPEEVLRWIDSLPLFHEEPDCILVHAGLRPGVALMKQTTEDMLWIRDEFHQGYRGKLVIFGHTPTPLLHGEFKPRYDPWFGVDKIGIDTGACFENTHGGCLTLCDIDTWKTWMA